VSLPEFSVKHSVFGNMLTLFVLVGGLVMLTFLQRDTFPEIELDLVVVSTRYPNASPEEVESLITNPIEEKIKEVEGIEEYFSSSVEGLSVITIQVDEEARYKDRVINEIQRKVDQVSDLPKEAEDPEVESILAQGPMIRVVITGPVEEARLRDFGDRLKDRLETIGGVSSVEKSGWRDEEFWVEADLGELVRQELSLGDIAAALSAQNINLPGGKMPEGDHEVVLRTLGQFYTAEEIRDVVVRSNSDGNLVRVGDVAEVTRTYEEDVLFTKANGTRAVVLGVKKKRSGDTITIADAVKVQLVEAQASAPEGIRIFHVDDESFYVKRRLHVLSSNGLIGFVMVVAILFLFLNFRVALVTGLGIPFAFLAALMIMSGFGITINLMTMFGLIIVLGMVVDDAIIVGENIFRHMEEGRDPRTAAIEGTREVMYPVVATVLTTMAAFAPLAFAPDVFGQVLKWLPITVAIALLASLLESLVVLPCHVVDFVPPLRGERRRVRDGKKAGHPVMDRVMAFYTSQVRLALRWRWIFLPVVLVVFGGLILFGMRTVRVDIFPADLIDIFKVSVAAEQGTRLETTERIMGEVEKRIETLPDSELQDIVTFVGGHISEQGFTARGTHYASALVYLTPAPLRGHPGHRETGVQHDRTRAAHGEPPRGQGAGRRLRYAQSYRRGDHGIPRQLRRGDGYPVRLRTR
jgi:multidrug efflux pump subunit AcrB